MRNDIKKRLDRLENIYTPEPTMILLCSPSGEQITINSKEWDKYSEDYPYFERIVEGGSQKEALRVLDMVLEATRLETFRECGENEEAMQQAENIK